MQFFSDSNQPKAPASYESTDDLLKPLTPSEQKLARVIELNRRLEVLAETQQSYVEFLRQTKKVAKDIGIQDQKLQDEQDKRTTRKKLSS